MPWELYRASIPRRPLPKLKPGPNDVKSHMMQLAHSELRTHQGFYLFLTVISPLLGAMFLRFVLNSVSGADQISWFSTTLFVLATGMRPWSHLLSRLRQRTHDLHDTIHYPSPESAFVATLKLQGAMKRVDTLERELEDIKGRVASNAGVEEVFEDLNGGIEEIEKIVVAGEKYERLKKQDASGAEEPPAPWRKNQERDRQFNKQHRGCREPLEPERQLLHVPSYWRW